MLDYQRKSGDVKGSAVAETQAVARDQLSQIQARAEILKRFVGEADR